MRHHITYVHVSRHVCEWMRSPCQKESRDRCTHTWRWRHHLHLQLVVHVWRDSFTYVTWWRDSFTYVTWWRDSVTYVTWLLLGLCAPHVCLYTWSVYVVCARGLCTWSLYVCAVTHSRTWRHLSAHWYVHAAFSETNHLCRPCHAFLCTGTDGTWRQVVMSGYMWLGRVTCMNESCPVICG